MASFNRVILAGNLTRDPELRFTQAGVPVCNFGIAVNDPRSKQERVDYFDIAAWRELGEIVANYKKKGDGVLVEGKLRFRTYEDNQGNKRSAVSIDADQVQFLSNAGGRQDAPKNSDTSGRTNDDITDEDFEDIPF